MEDKKKEVQTRVTKIVVAFKYSGLPNKYSECTHKIYCVF